MLKSLLQFPEQLQTEADQPAVVRVAAACSDLLALLALAGIVDTDGINTGQKEAHVTASNDISLVESEVIQTLHDEGRVSKHLADLAAERFGNKAADPSTMTAGVGLPGGSTLHLLHDSLSNRLAAKAAVSWPVPVHKYTIRRSSALRPNVRTGFLKSKKTLAVHGNGSKPQPSSSAATSKQNPNTMTLVTKRRALVRKSSKKTAKAHKKKVRSNAHHSAKANNRSGDSVAEEEDAEQRERERLWRQLMPLLANQDVVLLNDQEESHDWWATIDDLDQLLARATTLEADIQATQQQLLDCDYDKHQDSSGNISDLDTAVHEAHDMLRSIGFLPPLGAEGGISRDDCACEGTEAHDRMNAGAQHKLEHDIHSQDCLDRRGVHRGSGGDESDGGRGRCSCHHSGTNPSGGVQVRICSNCDERRNHYGDDISSSGGLNELRRMREEFWTGLAASGHVET